VATAPTPGGDPDRWWTLERAWWRLTGGTSRDEMAAPAADGRGPWGRWPVPPADLGPGWEWFHVHLFAAAVPAVEALHASWGIEPEMTAATVANIGRNVGIHRQMRGTAGLHSPEWLTLGVRGALVHVERLQFRRARAHWSRPDALFAEGDPVLDLHIPPTGPLSPAAVDRSLAGARALFGRVFPEDDSDWAVCGSWLLDPQLRDYLPPDSNIVRFQQRFHLDPDWSLPGDDSIIEFVFRRLQTPVDALDPHTTLEHAVVDLIRSGHHWQLRRGWF
jgi:GNAT-like C-terminal domain/N-acyltransferase N-terminal domain